MSSPFATIRAALGLAALLGGLGLCGSAWAQEKGLPECPKDRSLRWHNCFGTLVLPNGENTLANLITETVKAGVLKLGLMGKNMSASGETINTMGRGYYTDRTVPSILWVTGKTIDAHNQLTTHPLG